MSGKFRICSLAAISFALASTAVFAEDGGRPYSNVYFMDKDFGKQKRETNADSGKTRFTINGYTLYSYTPNDISGVRSKALGDFLLRRGSHSRAIQHYEKALKNVSNEADIYFNLGNIYFEEKVYNLAARYYSIATNKYLLPENFGKTQKYRYLSLIRYAISLKKMESVEDNHQDAQKITMDLMDSRAEILKNYPEISDELERLYHIVYGDVYIIPNK